MSALTVGISDIIAVILCAITPATSVLVLLAIDFIENYSVKLLRNGDQRIDPTPLRRKVKVVLEVILQLVSVGILLKMIHLMAEEVLEIISDSKEVDANDSLYIPTVACIVVGSIAAMGLVWYVEGGSHEGHGHADKNGGVEATKSSRGVIFAMLMHTCAEGLAAGVIMSTGKGTEHVSSMLDITSAYFISLALHNVSEGLVVATAVRTEITDEAAATRTRRSANYWVVPAALKTTFSHIGQPFGLLAILFAPQLGLSALTDYPLFIAFIQGVSLGSISAAVLIESLPEVWDAAKDFAEVFLSSNSGQKKKSN